MQYREPLPDGTQVRFIRSTHGARAGDVGTTFSDPSLPGTVLVRLARLDRDWLVLYGPYAIRQLREGRTWELVQ